MSPQTESPKPEQPPRRPKRKIVYWFLLVLSTMGLLPLGLSAYKLIDYSREALVTSQQEVQLMIAAAVVRQLDASVEGLRAQVTRLAESAGASQRAGGGRAIDAALLERLLGSEFLMLRYAPRAGPPAEARQRGFPADRIGRAMAQAVRAALDGEAIVTDPIRLRGQGESRTVLVVAVPVGGGRPAPAALAAVADFDTLWRP
ncbi:MAG: hypothetical protein ACRD6R_09730, partial [Candidatus Polarisedimenticolia bacterium]